MHRVRAGSFVAAIAGLVIAAFVVGGPRPAVQAAALVVDSTLDTSDANPGDGSCNDGAGRCTFRAAVEESEALAGRDVIRFDIPGSGPHRIQLGSALPLITDAAGLEIDGYSEPGAAQNTLDHGSNAVIQIELRGTGPSGIDGLDFRSGGNVVRGIAMFDFRRAIRMWGTNSTGNQVVGNFLGTDAAASFGAGSFTSGSNAVHIERGANANSIGLPGNAHRNVISGNADKAVAIFNRDSDANLVRNNLMGLAPDGVSALPNRGHGVDINLGASGNQVGGPSAGDRNVISGNGRSAVEISHNSSLGVIARDNLIQGNWIGTTADGSAGTAATANGEHGVNLEGNELCITTCPDDIRSNTVRDNVIVGSGAANVLIWKAAFDNEVRDNLIGALPNGSRPASWANTQWGVLIQAGAYDNVISGNTIRYLTAGVYVRPDSIYQAGEDPFTTSGNRITRNVIRDIEASPGGLGIDLYGDDPANPGAFKSGANEAPSPFVNGGIARPTIVSADTDRLVVDGCAGCTIEVFEASTPGCSSCWAEYGRGDRFVVDAVAPATQSTIVLRSAASDPYPLAAGSQVSVTVTDGSGNTSEFSRRVQVAPGALGNGGGGGGGGGVDAIVGPGDVSQPARRCDFSVDC